MNIEADNESTDSTEQSGQATETSEEQKPGGAAPPDEIKENLRNFKEGYPDPAKVGFLMMGFKETEANTAIAAAIKQTLGRYGLVAVRADESNYSEILVLNVKTYMWGCGFGIAVFENIQSDGFNPNVSFEVGYMLALQKPVCLLKDGTLRELHADLVGKLYHDFDTQNPATSISKELESWLHKSKIIPIS